MIDVSTAKGKCHICGGNDTLDSFVKTEYHNGMYHCLSCEADKLQSEYDPLDTGHYNIYPLKGRMLERLFRWVFG